MTVVKERNAHQTTLKKTQKLVEANETSMMDMESELETATKCLALIFGPQSEEQFMDEDSRISYEKVQVLYTDMKKVEKEKLKSAQSKGGQQAADVATEDDDQTNLITLL